MFLWLSACGSSGLEGPGWSAEDAGRDWEVNLDASQDAGPDGSSAFVDAGPDAKPPIDLRSIRCVMNEGRYQGFEVLCSDTVPGKGIYFGPYTSIAWDGNECATGLLPHSGCPTGTPCGVGVSLTGDPKDFVVAAGTCVGPEVQTCAGMKDAGDSIYCKDCHPFDAGVACGHICQGGTPDAGPLVCR